MSIAINLPDAVAPVAVATIDDLTPRERSVLELVAAGYNNQQICNQLFLSINSVKTYIRTSYRKIGVTSRAQAILWGIRYGLVDIEALAGRVGRAAAIAERGLMQRLVPRSLIEAVVTLAPAAVFAIVRAARPSR